MWTARDTLGFMLLYPSPLNNCQRSNEETVVSLLLFCMVMLIIPRSRRTGLIWCIRFWVPSWLCFCWSHRTLRPDTSSTGEKSEGFQVLCTSQNSCLQCQSWSSSAHILLQYIYHILGDRAERSFCPAEATSYYSRLMSLCSCWQLLFSLGKGWQLFQGFVWCVSMVLSLCWQLPWPHLWWKS